ncbi:MAG: hypothetical protein H6624_13850 [Bdellovibrionaceae bacterium]|nr:hypothetical protein [Bdellovibrionales bacterium]MCB9085424.1 hypothetical protein [Pseudobdellovibrionaceae bacterium]
MRGAELLNVVAEATGLPQSLIVNEIHRLAVKSGMSVETLTLDDLRDLLAEYLQDVLITAKSHYSPYP